MLTKKRPSARFAQSQEQRYGIAPFGLLDFLLLTTKEYMRRVSSRIARRTIGSRLTPRTRLATLSHPGSAVPLLRICVDLGVASSEWWSPLTVPRARDLLSSSPPIHSSGYAMGSSNLRSGRDMRPS